MWYALLQACNTALMHMDARQVCIWYLDARVLLQHDSNVMQQCRNKPKDTLILHSRQSTWNERGHCVHVTVVKPIQHTRQSLHLTAGDGKPAGQPCAQRDWSFLACVVEG